MRTDVDLWPLEAPAFARAIPALLEVYSAAMTPPRDQIAGRRSVMESHTALPGFTSVAAVTRGATAPPAPVGFAYGFPGRRGQWWYDVVTAAVRERDGEAAHRWFSTPFEIAEVHVHPDRQGEGIGRRMLRRLTAERREPTAVLSTHTGRTPARRLYRSFGFIDVLSGFYFPGSPGPAFTIMAAPLPLQEHRRAFDRSLWSPWTG